MREIRILERASGRRGDGGGTLLEPLAPAIGPPVGLARPVDDEFRQRDVIDSTKAIITPNEPGVGQHQWTDYVTSLDEIEKQTGYDFLGRVADAVERVIEAKVTAAR